MSIVYKEAPGEFHLYNDRVSYIIQILKNGQLGQLYFGERVQDRESFDHLLELARRDMAPCVFEGDSDFSLEHIKQEYPSYGTGDMRTPAFSVTHANGGFVTNFQYETHRIYAGKPKLKDLPATYTESDAEAETLEIDLRDTVLQAKLTLFYTIYADLPVITRSARFSCEGDGFALNSAMSLSLDLPDSDYTMIDLDGAWGRERQISEHPLHVGIQSVYSVRGHSSHQCNPFLALKRSNTTEQTGEAIGVSLVYSGNFLAQAEVDNFHVTRITMGIHPTAFCWNMKPGETFQTPEAVLVYSEHGLNGMSQTFHRLYRERLARGRWRDRPRPILINNWEATYMKFDEEKIVGLATKAHELGIELFVLDDGWFGHRNDDTTSLGDWFANPGKLPNGVAALADRIEALGMKFGLWFEPEMISKDSELYHTHPDWMLETPGYQPCHGRNQYVLDFSRNEIVDAIAEKLSILLRSAKISYVKWDMNRSLTDVYSRASNAAGQGEVFHRHVLGVYRLYETLTSRFPDVLFESCCSGGGRFDPGMLYYAPQAWTSDDTDAVERLKIQYGTSLVYPLSCMSNHVSAVPNHQAFRVTPLETRAAVACFGTFGYELDLNRLSEEERQAIKKQVNFVKENRAFLTTGTFYRLLSPFEGSETAWMVVSEDRRRALVGYYRSLQPVNEGYRRLKLAGLDPSSRYSVSDRSLTYYGDELMTIGFDISDTGNGPWTPQIYRGDYQSRLFEVKVL